MKRLINILVLFVLASAASVNVMAHPGHGNENPLSPGHYIFNPEHSIYLGIVILSGLALAWLVNRRSRQIQR